MTGADTTTRAGTVADTFLHRIHAGTSIDPDPVLPGWAGLATLFGAPAARLDEVGGDGTQVAVVAAGVPFDGTASSRPGAAEGPLAIRVASRIMAWQLQGWGARRMLDTRLGTTFEYERPNLYDVGDLPVYPTDPARTFDSLATHAAALAGRARKLVFLGGDHSVAFPLFVGFSGAHRGDVADVGYIQIDDHFDFGDHSAIHGHLYHGSNARRISELPGLDPRHMAFVGMAHPTRLEQYQKLLADGYHIITARQLRQAGVAAALAPVIAAMSDCRTIYLSTDIDVLDAAYAPGTGAVTMGGLDPGTLLDIMFALAPLPIGAIDMVEVAPRYDPTGRTAQLAAQILFEMLFRVTDSGSADAVPWTERQD
jgi:arginase family enzyme